PPARGRPRQVPGEAVARIDETHRPQIRARPIGSRLPEQGELPVRRDPEEFHIESGPRRVETGRPTRRARTLNPIEVPADARRRVPHPRRSPGCPWCTISARMMAAHRACRRAPADAGNPAETGGAPPLTASARATAWKE